MEWANQQFVERSLDVSFCCVLDHARHGKRLCMAMHTVGESIRIADRKQTIRPRLETF